MTPTPSFPDPLEGIAAQIDRAYGAALARATAGISPMSLTAAVGDWAAHLAMSPGRQMLLGAKAWRKAFRLADHMLHQMTDAPTGVRCIDPLPQDRRFVDPAWRDPPFELIHQAFLLMQQWWDVAATDVPGMTARHEQVMRFLVRQALDTVSPANFPASNPVVQREIGQSGGECLVQGWLNLIDDLRRLSARARPAGAEAFRPGHEVATTPGEVVYRNRLIELIQYHPTTAEVRPDPVLIVPAWIMKYYILDLTPDASLVRYLLDQGFSVFALSWRNPDASDRDLSFDDYRRMGVLAARDAVRAISGSPRLHLAGYCLGGTLAAITAAALCGNGDDSLASLTLIAAQTDFSEPGELGLFIDAGEVDYLADLMWAQGYLDSHQMSGAFQIIRSVDLIWSRMVQDYLLGRRAPLTALTAWNSDGTRLPQKMHEQYLRALYLNNDFAEGRLRVDGRPAVLENVHVPIFAVTTERDHVAPWRSVHKLHLLTDAEISFVLATGGHNTGIVVPPDTCKGAHRFLLRRAEGGYVDPELWLVQAEVRPGSWWVSWAQWLGQHSGAPAAPPPMGAPERGYVPMEPAPGAYVLQC